MSFVPTYKSRVLLGDVSLSANLVNFKEAFTANMLDQTTLADQAKVFGVGQNETALAMDGFYDPATVADQIAWTTAQPLTYAPSGLALNSEVFMWNALQGSFTTKSSIADSVRFDVAAMADGAYTPGVSLRDLTAETVDTSTTANDLGAVSTLTGAVAHLHVTAFSGFSGAAIIVEDSANNSLFATIGTFTTVSGVTTQRLTIAGTVRRYVRVSNDVTGSGSITYSVGFART